MKTVFTIILSLSWYFSIAQSLECFCEGNHFMNENTANCKIKKLENGSKLYWQFNCDRIWLTLEQLNGEKAIIDSVPVEFYSYTFRLGYQLFKEYRKYLLFRSGCSANGPCNFVLVDKKNGMKLMEFGELIYDHGSKRIYDFILYLSSKNVLTLHYVDSGKKYLIRLDGNQLNAVVPEYVFTIVTKDAKVLTLDYGKKKLSIDLGKYRDQ